MSRLSAPVAGAAGAIASVPVMWDVLGYHFPAGSMIVGLLAAVMARVFVSRKEKGPRDRTLDAIIMGVVLLTTTVWIATRHCDLWEALGTGFGIGTAGALILTISQARARAGIEAMFGKSGTDGTASTIEDKSGVGVALRSLPVPPPEE